MRPRHPSPPASRPGAAFLVVCALSGAASLVYEVLWLRQFSLWFGHGTAAAGTVLAAFMGGLAGGAWLAGRAADRLTPRRALEWYAALELSVAAFAWVLPHLLSLVQPWLGGAYADGAGGVGFVALRVAVSLALLGWPTVAMGATYPLAVRWYAGEAEPAVPGRLASRASRVYAANTVGAAAGTALGGFVLLPILGSGVAGWIAMAMTASAAMAAMTMARAASRGAMPGHAAAPMSASSWAPAPYGHVAALAVACSGFVALVSEVAWTRILTMVLGPTAYAFSGMLLASITGLALGAWAGAWLLPRIGQPGPWLGAALIAAAAATLAASSVVDRLPILMAGAAVAPDASFESVFPLQLGVGMAVQVPIALALGAVFTLALALVSPASGAARQAARVYAANTVGAIAGALTASFVLIPAAGLQATVRTGAALAAAAGAMVCWRTAASRMRLIAVGLAGVLLAATAGLPAWNRELLANGAYRYAPALAAGDLETGLEAGHLLFYEEGAAGTVSVRQLPGVRALAIDGKVDASNAEDMATQSLLAHVPLLLHPAPRDVLVVGLGSGVTAGAARRHPVSRVEVVEISPEVVSASRLFEAEHGGVLEDPRVRLIVGDGRSHLLLGARRYDVVISEPSNPWMAGVATLFTREFFAAVRGRLQPGGIFCQWAHTYTITDGDLRSIVATFLEAFPAGSAWLVGEADLLLIGSDAPIQALETGIAAAWTRPGVAADLARVDVRDPEVLLTLFLAQGDDLRRYAAGAPVQTDAALSLEFSAPRAIYGRFQQSNVAALQAVSSASARPAAVRAADAGLTAAMRAGRGAMRLRADAANGAYDDFAAAVRTGPITAEALDGLVRAAARAGRVDEAAGVLRASPMSGPAGSVLLALSRLLALDRDIEAATNVAREAVVRSGGDPDSLQQLAAMYAEVGDEAALQQLRAIVAPSPAHEAVAAYSDAQLAALAGDWRRAADAADRLVRLRPGDAEAFGLLGRAREGAGDDAAARRAFERGLATAPRTPALLEGLGRVELTSGRASYAADRFAEALFLQPARASALDGLARAYAAMGQSSRAARVRQALARTLAR